MTTRNRIGTHLRTLLLGIVVFSPVMITNAADDGVSSEQKVQLLKTYAPRVWLAKGERYQPSSVEWAFDQMTRVKQNDGRYWIVSKQQLSEPSDNSLPLFRGDHESAPVYAFWVDKSTAQEKTIDLVYFFFYPYNRGKEVAKTKMGNHVGDWEHITVRLKAADGVTARLAGTQWSYGGWQFKFGKETIEDFSNGWWEGVTWKATGPNEIELRNPAEDAKDFTMIMKFDSSDSFSTLDWDRQSIVTGQRIAVESTSTSSSGNFNFTPEKAYVSAHDFGGAYTWDKVTTLPGSSHPVVYSAEGSHGCYLSNDVHVYKEVKKLGVVLLKLQDECSEGIAWETFNFVKAYDFNEKKVLRDF